MFVADSESFTKSSLFIGFYRSLGSPPGGSHGQSASNDELRSSQRVGRGELLAAMGITW